MNCKEFQIEVEDGARGASLSASADSHLAGCPPCEKFSAEHAELQEWMAVCRKITAPKDFQFGVQRKIAVAQGRHSHDRIWRGLRYIVPASTAAAVLALALNFSVSQNSQIKSDPDSKLAVIANADLPEQKNLAPAVPQNDVPVIPAPADKAVTAENGANKPANNEKPVAPKQARDAEPPGGSLDTAAKDGTMTDTPKGIVLPKSAAESRSVTLQALLSAGAATNIEMRVLKVSGKAAAAGVQVGDIVQSFNGSTFVVSRGGLTLTLK